jgi:solute carrier family 25 phosphate transporter 3
MTIPFPSQSALQAQFAGQTTWSRRVPAKEPAQTARDPNTLFSAWSAVDDVKAEAHKLSEEAQKEYMKASAAAQAKAGKIELYSGKYYAACTLGGLLACVRSWKTNWRCNR